MEEKYLDYMKFCIKTIMKCMEDIAQEAVDQGLDTDENFKKFIDELIEND